MLSFSICLIRWYDHIQMELIFFTLNHFCDGLLHLSNQIDVQLAVELITLVLPKTLYLLALAKVLSDYPNNCLLHFFLQDMILSFCIDFIQEFFLTLLVCIVRFFLRHRNFRLVFKIFLKHLVVFSSESFNGDRNLLSKVVVAVFAVRPHNKLLKWKNIRGLRLWLSRFN